MFVLAVEGEEDVDEISGAHMVARGHGYISPEPRTRGVLDGLAHGVFPYFGMKAEVLKEDI